jgi:probable rRNA maturation factor
MSSTEGSTIRFSPAQPRLRAAAIRRFARVLETEVTKGRHFDCIITTNRELHKLNRMWRSKDNATDVLSFPVSPAVRKLRNFAGDIAISAARARSQARQYGHTAEIEICILMLHGVLHLMGMDHETDDGRMARAEQRWRTRLGLPSGLIEREEA